jgi:hypothetical protein
MSWDLPVSVPTFSGPLVKLSHEPDVGPCMIMIRIRGMVRCGWSRDHWVLGVAKAVLANRTGDKPPGPT